MDPGGTEDGRTGRREGKGRGVSMYTCVCTGVHVHDVSTCTGPVEELK